MRLGRRSHVLRTAGAAVLVFAVCAGAGIGPSCSSVTEVIVVVDGDLRDVDRVDIDVEIDGRGRVAAKTARLGVDATLPLTLGVQAGDNASSAFLVRATASRGETLVASRVVRARMVPGESRVLLASLCQVCKD